MLSQETFKAAMAMLTTAFPNMRVTRENTKVWFNFFKDLTDEQFILGVDTIVKTNAKTPTVAEIREAALSALLPQLSADEAWEKVIKAVRSGNLRSDTSFGDERIDRVVEIYYTDLKEMTADNRAIIRAQFMKTYNNLELREKKAELAGGKKVKALIDSIFQPSLGGRKDDIY